MSLYLSSGMVAQERIALANLRASFSVARNIKPWTISVFQQITKAGLAIDLNAANPHARLCWLKSLCDAFEKSFNLDECFTWKDQEYFLVSLSDVGCFRPIVDPGRDVTHLARQLLPGLKGLNYVAVLEPGYYTNISKGAGVGLAKGINWHVHAICWG